MRSNGGFVGAKKTVSTSAASGIWATRDAQREKGASNWPFVTVVATILVVGGGQGGRNGHSYGGGGGAVEEFASVALSPLLTYTATIGGGGGGAGAAGNADAGGTGGTSSFSGTGITTMSALGGSAPDGKGDGGTNAIVGRTGGAGQASTVTGTSIYYGGGGGTAGGNGYETSAGGAGGSGGGGTGSTCCSTPGTIGSDGFGGGGGGGGINWCGQTYCAGNRGGNGVVIVSYVGAQVYTGGTRTTNNGLYIHTFTSTGYLAPL